MKTPSRLLAQTGFVVAAAVLGFSVTQASAFNPPETPGRLSEVGLSRPSPDEPIETQIEQAIEVVNQGGQEALEELGELDTWEKIDRAEQILEQLGRTAYEIRKRAHDRSADRFDELNDLAIGRLGDEARAELRHVGETNTPEKQARAQAIRTRNALKKAQLEARSESQRQRVTQLRREQEWPKADFRLPNGRPPLFANAYGLRLRWENLTEEQADETIAQLERDVHNALERLGELDTPGKVQRAQKMRARLAERLQDLRERAAGKNMEAAGEQAGAREMDHAGDQYKERAEELRRRAEVAINELGELDTPEKQEQARQINARLEQALAALRERLSNVAGGEFEERLDREIQSLQRRTGAALEELGDLDTLERQEKARLIKARLAEKVQKLREQLARRSEAEAISRLKNQPVPQLDDQPGTRSDALTDSPGNRGRGNAADRMTDRMGGKTPAEPRDRAEQVRQAREKAMAALREPRDNQSKINDRVQAEQEQARARTRTRQEITPDPDRPRPAPEGGVRPTATTEPDREAEPTDPSEPREADPVRNDSTSDSDSSGSVSGRDQ